MKFHKKILCIFLALCLICSALIGCSKKDKNNAEATSVDTNDTIATQAPTNEYGEPSFTSSVPSLELDFEGEDLVILLRDVVSNTREWTKLAVEDELDEAIAMRNAAVEDTLNVSLVFERVPSSSLTTYFNSMVSMIQTDINSDLHYYDINCATECFVSRNELRDYAANLLDEEIFPFFDFSLPCWNQATVTNTRFGDKLFFVVGDSNISMYDAAIIMWYNKTLYDEKKEDTDPANIQDLALAGQWTYDELYKWATRLYEDSNGVQGRQSDDTYGLCTFPNNPCPADSIPFAWDLNFVTTQNDGSHSFNVLGNDKAEAALVKFKNLLSANGTTASDANTSNAVSNFANGKYVFYTDRIFYNAEDNMKIREMEDKYGILPMPKYDTAQENYGTTAQDYFNVFSVLDHSNSSEPTKGEAISAALQLANEESYTSVRGYYFNRIIKPKFFGTDDSEGTVTKSIALFDIIVANIELDYFSLYSPMLANIDHLWRNTCYSDQTLEQVYSGAQANFEKAIRSTDVWLGLIEEE